MLQNGKNLKRKEKKIPHHNLDRVLFFLLLFSSSINLLHLPSHAEFDCVGASVQKFNFKFNASNAYETIKKQVNYGARYPGSLGIEKTRKLIANELQSSINWDINFQNFTKKWNEEDVKLVNIICQPPNFDVSTPNFLLMAHYDTRLWATSDPDPERRRDSVPGANDGASGVGILLELGKVLVEYGITNFRLIFFDAEDQGGILGWDWLVGSRYYVSSKDSELQDISWAILLDMVGAINATFKRERNSDMYAKVLLDQIWDEAANLNYSNNFINESWKTILDDHVPFLQAGIPAIDIIDDFSSRYNPWHTTYDNLTYIDVDTLEAVGYTLESALQKLVQSTDWMNGLTRFNYVSKFTITVVLGSIIMISLIVRSSGKEARKIGKSNKINNS